jgi:hypothetical protein
VGVPGRQLTRLGDCWGADIFFSVSWRIVICFYPVEPWQIGKDGTVVTFSDWQKGCRITVNQLPVPERLPGRISAWWTPSSCTSSCSNVGDLALLLFPSLCQINEENQIWLLLLFLSPAHWATVGSGSGLWGWDLCDHGGKMFPVFRVSCFFHMFTVLKSWVEGSAWRFCSLHACVIQWVHGDSWSGMESCTFYWYPEAPELCSKWCETFTLCRLLC